MMKLLIVKKINKAYHDFYWSTILFVQYIFYAKMNG
jgi:hypothetical protein